MLDHNELVNVPILTNTPLVALGLEALTASISAVKLSRICCSLKLT